MKKGGVFMRAQDQTEDESKRKASAESLQRQIDDLKAGRSKPARPPSLRDFIERKMAEAKERVKKEHS
jgi:hypothetical protein